MNEAPDFVEPFEAWRVWRIVRREREYSLGSIVQRTVWPAGRALTADCLRTQRVLTRLRRRRPHGAPDAKPWRVGWEEVAFGLTRYRVPLELLASPAVDAAQFLTERQAA